MNKRCGRPFLIGLILIGDFIDFIDFVDLIYQILNRRGVPTYGTVGRSLTSNERVVATLHLFFLSEVNLVDENPAGKSGSGRKQQYMQYDWLSYEE